MQLLIKNMVCNRCVRVVREELEKIGLNVTKVELGIATINLTGENIQYDLIQNALQKEGFELIEDHKASIIERIKHLIINEIHHNKGQKPTSQNFSDFLVKKIGYEYSYLSNLFSSVEKTTLEKYIIAQKIERTKALLLNGEASLSEIAWQLDYSSVAHLSNQFKQVEGITPSDFKRHNLNTRIPIDSVKNHVSLM